MLLFDDLLSTCHRRAEFESLSIDCTFRLMMSLLGQVSYRAPKEVRARQPLSAEALHAALSARGKTGAQGSPTTPHTGNRDTAGSVQRVPRSLGLARNDLKRRSLAWEAFVFARRRVHTCLIGQRPSQLFGASKPTQATKLWNALCTPAARFASYSNAHEFEVHDRAWRRNQVR